MPMAQVTVHSPRCHSYLDLVVLCCNYGRPAVQSSEKPGNAPDSALHRTDKGIARPGGRKISILSTDGMNTDPFWCLGELWKP